MTREEHSKLLTEKIETEEDINEVVNIFKRKLAKLNLPIYEDIDDFVTKESHKFYGKSKARFENSIFGFCMRTHPEAHTIEWHYVWRDI